MNGIYEVTQGSLCTDYIYDQIEPAKDDGTLSIAAKNEYIDARAQDGEISMHK